MSNLNPSMETLAGKADLRQTKMMAMERAKG
jgi:hypothetical protein